MKLTQTGSLWGNLYRLRHYKDGVRISDEKFRHLFKQHIETEFTGERIYSQTSSTFRIDWIIPDACSDETHLSETRTPIGA